MPTGAAVTQSVVLGVFRRNLDLLRAVVLDALRRPPAECDCLCTDALDGINPPLLEG